MTPYWDMARKLKVPFCGGDCGIGERSHDAGFLDPFDVIHFRERRFTRRGAKRFLMLVALRERRLDPSYLNDVHRFGAWYIYHDSVRAQQLAGQLGFRIPAKAFDMERLRARYLARKVRGLTTTGARSWLAR